MNLLFYLAIMLFAGLLFGRLLKLVKLPNVTGYLIAGLVLGPFVTKILTAEQVESLSVISNMALSFIAFTVGLSFKRSYFKRVGMTPVVIALLEALVAVFLVQGALIAAGFDVAFSIVLGAIAAATAPAATIMVRCKGSCHRHAYGCCGNRRCRGTCRIRLCGLDRRCYQR